MARKIIFEIQTQTDLEGVDRQIQNIINSASSLKSAYNELRNAAQEASDPKDFERLTRAAGDLKNRIDETNRSVRAFSSDTRRLDVVIGTVRGIAGAFAATQGAIALLAGENDNLQKILVKVQGSLAVLNGLQQVNQVLSKKNAAGLALYRAQQTLLNSSIFSGAKALNIFQSALVATGVGALVVGIGLLIANFDKITEALGLSKSAMEEFEEAQRKASESMDNKILKSAIETEREFNSLRQEIELTIDPIEKLEKLVKRFPEFKALDPKDPDLADKINEKLARREKILTITKEEGAIIEAQNERLLKIVELRIERDRAILAGDRQKVTLLGKQIESLLKIQAAQTDSLTTLRQQRVAIETNIRTEVVGIAEKEKADDKAEKKRLEAIRNREQAARIDEQNRIALIENRVQRELSLISLRYDLERREARKIGADITQINAREERERAAFIQNQQKALGEVILKAFRGVNDDLKKLSLSTYQEDLKAFREAQNQKRDKLIEDLILIQEQYIGISKALDQSDDFLDDLIQRNEALKKIFSGLKGEANTLKVALIEAERSLERLSDIEVREQELLRLNSIIDGLKFVINLEERIGDIKFLNGEAEIKRLKEEIGFSEDLSDLKIILTKREAELRLLEEQKVLEGISVAGDKAIFDRLKKNEIANDQLTEKQARYVDRIININRLLADDDERRYEELNKLEEEFVNEGLAFRRDYFQRLNELKQKSLEDEIRINKRFIDVERESRGRGGQFFQNALQDERDFLTAKAALLQNELVTEEERQKQLLKLEARYRALSIEAQIEVRRKKLEILTEEGRQTTQLYSEIYNEVLQLQIDLFEQQKIITGQQTVNLTDILRQFVQELTFQTDNILSGIANIYSTAQSENQRLLQQGKITAEENERRQKELFEQQKKIEISRTVISTLSSAQGAYQSQFVPVPDPSSPIRGSLFATAALIAGFARVKAIQAQNYSGSAVSPPQSTQTTASFLRDPGTSRIIQPQTDPNIVPSIKVFVTETDITETQRRVRVIQNGSRATF